MKEECDSSMKKLVMLVMVVFFVGCASNDVMNKNEIMETKSSKLPKVDAFQDDYTKQFMYSTKEVEQGYYLFESLTKEYTMNFPENGLVLDSLKNNDDTLERMEFMFRFSDELLPPYYKMKFVFHTLENNEKALQKMPVYSDVEVDYRNEMEKIETDDSVIHHVMIERDIYDEINYHLTGIIESKKIPRMIYYNARVTVDSTGGPLHDKVLKEISDEVLKQLETVEFTKVKE